jgi:hypothetical protein
LDCPCIFETTGSNVADACKATDTETGMLKYPMTNCLYSQEEKSYRMPSIISIMIALAFSAGKPTKEGDEGYLGLENPTMFTYGLTLFGMVGVCVPLFLFAIPCCFRNSG